ncbi:type III glutamate--ammonia ligase [Thiomicrorhabdus indica]|uniref:type III glutamate--ammonia ligase n=1 Tax=Thiomicrorhabdus indica TaxID=2267253 RepID=UPI00102D73B8|nr:type III glutamate--ammonia ligase [Thiomicrorhabdus indica]
MTIEEAKKFLEENQIKYILAQFVDIHGVAKTKSVPASCLEAIVEDGAGFAGFAVWGLGMEPHDGDYMAKADLSTLSLVPWQPGYARIACTGHVHDQPYEFDTRHIMLKQIERLSEKGWTLNTGIEPEFSLLRRDEKGHLVPFDESDTLDKPCYDYKGLSRSRVFLEKFVDSLQQVGFDVYQIDHEDANGQFEINYTYSDAKTSADRITFVRMAGSEIANELGMICSFMPKPNANRTGNGFHYHLSITDDQGNNLFKDDSDTNNMGLSKLAYHFLGGLMHHAKALCAFAAPTVNSYKRLVVGRSLSGATWAPAFISYGDNNRSAMVRVPYGRLEFRLPDTGSNAYLVTAAIIAAGLDGVANKLDPGEPHNINHYALSLEEIKERGIDTLPQSLSEALDELEEDSLFVEQFGEGFMKEFIDIKRMEWVEYQRHVSDWELNRYAEYF